MIDNAIPAENTVFTTSNLTQFKDSPEQRPVNPYHKARLMKAIEKKNLLPDFPILIDDQMRVIDGQHRLAVARELSIPIHFRMSSVTSFEDVGFANSNVKKWGMTDYLHYWCEKNVQPYLDLRDFLSAHDWMKLGDVVQLMSGSINSVDAANGKNFASSNGAVRPWRVRFEDGEWTITNLPRAYQISNAVKDFAPFYTGWKRTKFVNCVLKLFNDGRYDHKRMLHQMEKYAGTKMRHCTRLDEYMETLESIYNHRRSEKYHVVGLGTKR